MGAEASVPTCPQCGGALTTVSGDVWCPRCALAGVMEPDSEDPAVPSGRFPVAGHVVLEELGRGATGIVFRARQLQPDREVALKILRPHEAGSVEMRARFRLEAATVATLDHPGILPVYSVGENDGLPYFTMKLCADTLATRAGRYRGRWREIAALVAGVAHAVHHAHARGVLHRDIKPGNIFFDDAGRAFVGDFGLAKTPAAVEPRDAAAPAMTRPMLVMGTPGYIAPEILATGAGTAVVGSDVFALGAVLHELLAGAPPASASPAAPGGAPRDLALICAHCLEPEPVRRYPSAEALAQDLEAWLEGRSIAARPAGPWEQARAWAGRHRTVATSVAAFALLLVGGTAVLLLQNRKLARALAETRVAEARANDSLADALVAQARAIRQSGRGGQKFEAVALLARAGRLKAGDETRDEALAALALPDWKFSRHQYGGSSSGFAVPSPDFTRIFVEQADHEFSLRETATGRVIWRWQGPAAALSQHVFSPDGRWVAVRLEDDTVHVFVAADGREVLKLEGRPYAYKGSVTGYGHDMDFSPDGSRLTVTRPEGGVTFHRLPGGEPDGEWTSPEWVTSVAWSPDGTRLAAAGGRRRTDRLLAVVDTRTGRTVTSLMPANRIEFVTWSQDGRWLALRPFGALTEVRAAADLALRATIPDNEALFGHFLPDGQRLLLTGQSGRTRLWDIDLGTTLLAKAGEGQPGTWFAGTPPRLFHRNSSGQATVVQLEDSAITRTVRVPETGETVRPNGMAANLSPDGRWLAMGTWGGGMLIDLETGRVAHRLLPGADNEAGMLCFSPDGSSLWVNLEKGGLRRAAFPSGAEPGPESPLERVSDEPQFYLAAVCAETRRLAFVSPATGVVRLIDTTTGAVTARWAHRGAVSASFSPDGRFIAVNGRHTDDSEPATVYETASGRSVRTLEAKPGNYVVWSPDGRWLYAGFGNGLARLWRTADWTEGPKLMQADDDYLRAAAFPPDGSRIIMRDSDGKFRLVDTGTGRIIARFTPPESIGFISALMFDGNDRFYAVSSTGRVWMWDIAAARREAGALGLELK